jgi:hypothetical protein
VHRPRLYYKHVDQANSPPLQNIDSVVWKDIRDELLRLSEIIHPTEEIDESLEALVYSIAPPFAT